MQRIYRKGVIRIFVAVDSQIKVATIAPMATKTEVQAVPRMRISRPTRMAAKDAKNRFGQLLEHAQQAPVTIAKNGRAVAVVLGGVDYEDFKRFQEMEDRIWGERALKAEREGKWLGPKKSEAFLKKMLNA